MFHIGIIDYLTRYTKIKKIEKFAKSLTADPKTVSVAPPEFYGDRFKSFMTKEVI
jgi:hypothetical protein